MSVSPQAAMRTMVRRFEALQAQWKARADGLVAQVHARVPALAIEHGAAEVFLFGSLAWGDPDAQSDIDLAVAGLDVLAFDRFAAGAYMALDAPVDVVRLEDAPDSLRARVRDAGVLVYRRGVR